MAMVMLAGTVAGASGMTAVGQAAAAPVFGPENPFYAESTLPYHAPPFDKIKDTDYQPALEAGMAEQIQEVEAIANSPAAPTFANTLVALEKSGQLYTRVAETFDGVAQANTNATLDKVNEIESPKRAAHQDAIFLNEKLFARVATIHKKMNTLGLDAESRRLVDVYYKMFVHLGANLSAEDKAKLKKLNEEESTLENSYRTKLLAATKEAAYTTTDKSALQGLTDAEVAAAAEAAKERKVDGYVLPLQNTTQQPVLVSLANRATRQAVYEDGWNRAERGGANDTRDTIARLAQLRAEKAKLLGYPNYAAWNLEDQMAKTPDAAIKFMDALVPASTANAIAEGKDIQALIDAQKGGFQLQPWDWEFYSEQVRKAKYDIDDAQVKPYFEINNVLQNGVFYAANRMYGLTFKERKDIPVYAPDVRVFEVFEESGKPLALMYFDYYKRDNKGGGAWMSNFVDQSKLLGRLPVIYNVANFSKPAAGEPALISFTDVTTMFHEFGHALHGMFSNVQYPMLSGTSVPRDFVEFPSQFNEHWASYPAIFDHFAKHYKTGAPMPAEMAAKLRKADKFNQGYLLTELLAAAELDMQWHTHFGDRRRCRIQTHSSRRRWSGRRLRWRRFLRATGRATSRTSGVKAMRRDTTRICGARCWTTTRTSGSWSMAGRRAPTESASAGWCCRRDTREELGKMYAAWLGGEPTAGPMLKERGLVEDGAGK